MLVAYVAYFGDFKYPLPRKNIFGKFGKNLQLFPPVKFVLIYLEGISITSSVFTGSK